MEKTKKFAENRGILVGWILILLTVNGCAGVGKRWEPPRVSLVDIQVLKATLFETAFKV